VKLAPALMVQGTASNVGKSLLVTALCRLFRQDGLRVLPFKSQNMALNSFVTPDGGEIGRAQAVQAEAAGVAPTVDMNPILLKPEGDARSQVVVLGKALGSMSAAEYHAGKPELRAVIAECLTRLRQRCDLLVIEGAGSPAEVNLKQHEIVNMHVARAAEARVLLVGDIDRGGVLAAFVGTMELLEPEERALVAGFVVNKFRGDLGLLRPGLDFLTRRTGVPVVGVVPYLPALRIADEDSLGLESRRGRRRAGPDEVEIAIVRLPRLSNYDDFVPLEHEPGVVVRFVENARELEGADLVVLPGSKSTVADLAWLRSARLADAIVARVARGEPVLGICGGFQMMGRTIEDPGRVESAEVHTNGLGLLPVRTRFEAPKITAQVQAQAAARTFLTEALPAGATLAGYEIHMGRVEPAAEGCPRVFALVARNGEPASDPSSALDGAVAHQGLAVGTLLHGIFDDGRVRASLLGFLRRRRGITDVGPAAIPSKDAEYDRLAAALREHLDPEALRRAAGLAR
jgi:adenosylcobyric acid synthase